MGRGSAGGHVTNAEVTTNQITWQVGTLREVGDGIDYFKSIGIDPGRVGRDVPGSNWHSYPSDPEGHTNEIYYGIEQIGWNLQSKPPAVRKRGFHEKPDLPQISEYQETAAPVNVIGSATRASSCSAVSPSRASAASRSKTSFSACAARACRARRRPRAP